MDSYPQSGSGIDPLLPLGQKAASIWECLISLWHTQCCPPTKRNSLGTQDELLGSVFVTFTVVSASTIQWCRRANRQPPRLHRNVWTYNQKWAQIGKMAIDKLQITNHRRMKFFFNEWMNQFISSSSLRTLTSHPAPQAPRDTKIAGGSPWLFSMITARLVKFGFQTSKLYTPKEGLPGN